MDKILLSRIIFKVLILIHTYIKDKLRGCFCFKEQYLIITLFIIINNYFIILKYNSTPSTSESLAEKLNTGLNAWVLLTSKELFNTAWKPSKFSNLLNILSIPVYAVSAIRKEDLSFFPTFGSIPQPYGNFQQYSIAYVNWSKPASLEFH